MAGGRIMLSQQINRYVELQRSVGFKFHAQSLLLKNFIAFARSHDDRFIKASRAVEWAGKAPSPPQRYNRLATLRRCALALHAQDARHQVPPVDVFGCQWFKRGVRHIYTSGEIAQLINSAAALGPKHSIRPITYATLLGLLASTGLRISEALALTIDDLTSDGLLIRKTKFKKDRLVPLHESTRAALRRYLVARANVVTHERVLFVSPAGTGVKYSTVITNFLSLARKIGLRGAPGRKGARLHDLRHTFAVRSLERCVGDRQSVAQHIMGLSTYLGHAHVSDTYWYLQATPALMRQIAHAGEALHSRGRL
jgi:integrase